RHSLISIYNNTATPKTYTLSLHDALPISGDDGESLLGVLRSNDGGQNWKACGTTLTTAIPNQGDLLPAAGNQGDTWNNCITASRSEEHTSELQSHLNLVCRLLLEKKNTTK